MDGKFSEASDAAKLKYTYLFAVTDGIPVLINSLVTIFAFSSVYVLIACTNSFTAIVKVSFSAMDDTCDKYTS